MKKALLLITAVMASFTTVAFEEVEVTPMFPQGWQAINVRDDGLVEINKNQPLFGDGSLMFATDTQTNGQDKADYELLWQESTTMIDFPNRTLGNITKLNYAWYKDAASTTGVNLLPVYRLRFYDDGGTPADLSDDVLGLLIWEAVYNGLGSIPTDSWELQDIDQENFWVFVNQSAQGSGVIQNFNSSLSDWINNTPMGQPGDPVINLSADTYILGINIGVGSGWGNSFIGYVDAVRIAFGLSDDQLFNFEACPIFTPNSNPDVIFDDSFECFK